MTARASFDLPRIYLPKLLFIEEIEQLVLLSGIPISDLQRTDFKGIHTQALQAMYHNGMMTQALAAIRNAREVEDIPCLCPYCHHWLTNQAELERHVNYETAQICHRMRSWCQNAIDRQLHALTSPLVTVLFQENHIPKGLATIQQMKQLAAEEYGTPLMCKHCFAFFVGPQCLAEHYSVVAGETAGLPSWGKKPLDKRGHIIPMASKDTRVLPRLPGSGIRSPYLSGYCTCWKTAEICKYHEYDMKKYCPQSAQTVFEAISLPQGIAC
jgi:hypothetical protein